MEKKFKSFAELGEKVYGIRPIKTEDSETKKATIVAAIKRVADPDGSQREPSKPCYNIELELDVIIELIKLEQSNHLAVALESCYEDDNGEEITETTYISFRNFSEKEYSCDYDYGYIEYYVAAENKIIDIDNYTIIDIDKARSLMRDLEYLALGFDSSEDEIKAAVYAEKGRYNTAYKKYEAELAAYNEREASIDAMRASMKNIDKTKAHNICVLVTSAYEGGKGAIKRLKNYMKNKFQYFETYFGFDPIFIITDDDNKYGYFTIANNQGDINACSVDVYNLDGEMLASRYLI